jgi:hypothetical protein
MCSVLWMWVCDLHAMKAEPAGRHPKVPLGVESSAAAWDTEVPSGVCAAVRLRENAGGKVEDRPRSASRAGLTMGSPIREGWLSLVVLRGWVADG